MQCDQNFGEKGRIKDKQEKNLTKQIPRDLIRLHRIFKNIVSYSHDYGGNMGGLSQEF